MYFIAILSGWHYSSRHRSAFTLTSDINCSVSAAFQLYPPALSASSVHQLYSPALSACSVCPPVLSACSQFCPPALSVRESHALIMQSTLQLPPETTSRLILEAKSLLRQATTEPLHDMILKNLVNEVQHHYNAVLASLEAHYNSLVTSLQSEVIQLQTQNAHLSNEAAKLEKQTIGHLSEALNKATTSATPNPHAQYRGSMSRAKNWGAQILLPTTQLNRDTPSLTTLHQAYGMDTVLVHRLMELSSGDEQDIAYPAVIDTLAQIFAPQVELGLGTTYVLDTHERRYLN
ncbi:hypothetical protein L211DRAFT_579328 [Terfezia boudieri ATCC MYA-4762]|uniref:Uncharacterized protein n=1 Tax=Terfezia boudieri ATCC MYA-4762 TaxID=1051890 RepID=A0A3N4LB96_9PEZI|nr:hypothetical protein L211DRAFT_579328 [Terfezia boudieri ATCC MYA-4762]